MTRTVKHPMSVEGTISSVSRYAILGCGSVGYAVAEELIAENKDVLILDKDESRVESLRDQDLNANQLDIAEPESVEVVADREVVLILRFVSAVVSSLLSREHQIRSQRMS